MIEYVATLVYSHNGISDPSGHAWIHEKLAKSSGPLEYKCYRTYYHLDSTITVKFNDKIVLQFFLFEKHMSHGITIMIEKIVYDEKAANDFMFFGKLLT